METSCRHAIDSLTNLIRLHLRHLSTHGAYLMAMAVVIIAGLILRCGLKAMAHHKAQLNKQAQRIVERSTTHREIVVVSQFIAKLL